MSILRSVRDRSIDQRQTARPPAMKTADIEFGYVLIACTILNLSRKGLQVCLPGHYEVPDQVTVRFGDGTSRQALRRWRQDDDMGFEFLTA